MFVQTINVLKSVRYVAEISLYDGTSVAGNFHKNIIWNKIKVNLVSSNIIKPFRGISTRSVNEDDGDYFFITMPLSLNSIQNII